jgi:hypothetical protein
MRMIFQNIIGKMSWGKCINNNRLAQQDNYSFVNSR